MRNNFPWFGRGGSPLPRLALAAGVLMLPLAGCDVEELLDVEDPDIASPGSFTDATALPAIRAATIGDFSVAYDGTDGQVLYSGLLGDEWFHSGTFPTRTEIDIRNISEDNTTLQGATRNLYRARATAERAAADFARLAPEAAGGAEALNLAGFTYVLFGENYCSGVPFSELNAEGQLVFGPRETTQQVFERALDRANRALEVAIDAGSTEQINLARVLQGRALLNLGRYQDAAAAVEGVPTLFIYRFPHSENTSRENNGIFIQNILVERWSVANNEGGNGLPYRTAFAEGDPRTPWRRAPANDVGFDRGTPQYDQLAYFTRSASTPLAMGAEARLIEAEAALQRGDLVTYITRLNELRDQSEEILSGRIENPPYDISSYELDDLVLPATEQERVDLLFQERAYWLWLTSHRLGDMRRLVRQYDRPANEVFPVGDYHKTIQGGVYGDDVNLPISFDERNNPEVAGLNIPSNQSVCLDREA